MWKKNETRELNCSDENHMLSYTPLIEDFDAKNNVMLFRFIT